MGGVAFSLSGKRYSRVNQRLYPGRQLHSLIRVRCCVTVDLRDAFAILLYAITRCNPVDRRPVFSFSWRSSTTSPTRCRGSNPSSSLYQLVLSLSSSITPFSMTAQNSPHLSQYQYRNNAIRAGKAKYWKNQASR